MHACMHDARNTHTVALLVRQDRLSFNRTPDWYGEVEDWLLFKKHAIPALAEAQTDLPKEGKYACNTHA